jgi:hypothetical protein
MPIRLFFRFPELLLLLSILIPPILIGNTTVDIQVHDTFFVFGGKTIIGNTFYEDVAGMMVFSWLTHILLRKRALMPEILRWAQVILSVLSIAAFSVIIMLYYEGRQNTSSSMDQLLLNYQLSTLIPWAVILFVLLQLGLWIATTILLFRIQGSTHRS